MATTEKGIYYPADYDEVADIPDDMKKMAESIDDVIEHDRGLVDEFVEETNQKIETIQAEQTTQNENIQENTDNIEALTAKHNAEVAELQEQLDMAADLIPTGDASGSDITLSDSARYYFKKIVPGGKSEQEQYKGQQLYNVRDIANMGSYTVDKDDWLSLINWAGPGNANYFTRNLNLEASTTYSIILEVKSISGTGKLYIYTTYQNGGQFPGNKVIDFSNLTAGQKYVYKETTKEDLSEVTSGLRTYITTTDSASIVFRISVIADTTVTADTFNYEPYTGGQPAPNPNYESPIKNVTGNVEVKVENQENIIPTKIDEWEQGTITASNGNLQDSTTRIRTKKFIELKSHKYYGKIQNQDYCFLNVMFYNENETYLGSYDANVSVINGESEIVLNFPTNVYKIKVLIRNKNNTTDIIPSEILAIKPLIVEDYDNYEEQTAIFPLEEGQRLHKNDTIEDKIVQKRKTIVFDGTENWSLFFSTQGIFTRSLSNVAVNSATTKNVISNYFIGTNRNYIRYNLATADNLISCFGAELTIANKSITTAADFKAWVAEKYANGTPLTIEYELAEPIETEFTEAQRTAKAQIDKLYSYKGTTYITSNANLDVTYRKDLETIIDNLSNAIVAQGGI